MGRRLLECPMSGRRHDNAIIPNSIVFLRLTPCQMVGFAGIPFITSAGTCCSLFWVVCFRCWFRNIIK